MLRWNKISAQDCDQNDESEVEQVKCELKKVFTNETYICNVILLAKAILNYERDLIRRKRIKRTIRKIRIVFNK